jgi:hypothetical protein
MLLWNQNVHYLHHKDILQSHLYAFHPVVSIFLIALQPLWALASFQFPDLFTIGWTPWTSEQLVARLLPKHRTAQTQNKHMHIKHPCPKWDSSERR